MNELVTTTDEIPIAAVRIGERTRRDMGDIKALARSIEEQGLLHSIVVTESGELIAGARRLAAFRELGRVTIPVRVVNLEHLVFGEQAEKHRPQGLHDRRASRDRREDRGAPRRPPG